MPTLRDCVYGQAVADALGVPYEFRLRGSFRCTDMVGYGSHNQPAGTWSDDASMTLAICDGYRELWRIDVDDIRGRFVRWYREDAYTVDGLFDIGNATREALERGHGLAGEWDNGNGSLMRTVPLAFTDATDDEVRAVSSITHTHSTSTEACVAMVHVARDLIAGASPADVASDVAARPVDEISSGGFVRHTFDASLLPGQHVELRRARALRGEPRGRHGRHGRRRRRAHRHCLRHRGDPGRAARQAARRGSNRGMLVLRCAPSALFPLLLRLLLAEWAPFSAVDPGRGRHAPGMAGVIAADPLWRKVELAERLGIPRTHWVVRAPFCGELGVFPRKGAHHFPACGAAVVHSQLSLPYRSIPLMSAHDAAPGHCALAPASYVLWGITISVPGA